ncbi:DUF4351 domain-containing protein [Oceanospirillum sediminis]|uniref:DUF4351 domain-containing protein n=1 Tax=Oceanospirillum sediminis TaxID=2760088 RepID=A0A839INC4_9GAMM|nr:DUF4351 domain-containing protein [Oceanospirillum sediminis]MBB1486194.1 DUF4351 domain-containing protein [Oceanospirillum sediminis]
MIEQRDRHQPEVRLGKELQLNLIEMRKADKLNLSSGALNAWITFFEHWQEELIMADIAYQPVKDALQRVKDLSADEEAQRMAFVRERARYEEASLLKDATDNGMEKGIEIGERKGQIELLTRLLNRRFGELPDWVSDKLESAETEDLAQWSENILFADTLEPVFEPTPDP